MQKGDTLRVVSNMNNIRSRAEEIVKNELIYS
ncbi:TnpV protein [Phascolarctobacterium succinatutens]